MRATAVQAHSTRSAHASPQRYRADCRADFFARERDAAGCRCVSYAHQTMLWVIATMAVSDSELATLFGAHLAHVTKHLERAAERAQCAGFVIAAGTPTSYFRDDRGVPFEPAPLFRWLVPVGEGNDCYVVFDPKRDKPTLVFSQPADYWHMPPADPTGFWTGSFDIRTAATEDEARAAIGALTTHEFAYLGPDNAGVTSGLADNPAAAHAYLDFHRGQKSDYELHCMRAASARGVLGHQAAAAAFAAGASEFEIHQAYLNASQQTASDLPYSSIVALNEHGAVLHYQHYERAAPHAAERRSFLIDAGARVRGYASDITRTYCNEHNQHAATSLFATLIAELDQHQQALIDTIVPGKSYIELHNDLHARLGAMLQATGLINCSAEAAVATGITRTVMPHGLGHLLGIQTHDAGGLIGDDAGTPAPPPPQDAALRFTRQIEVGQVFTIEPGLYFIDMLLAQLRAAPAGSSVDWPTLDSLRPFGGIRIEDNIVVGTSGNENLTRDAFAASAA